VYILRTKVVSFASLYENRSVLVDLARFTLLTEVVLRYVCTIYAHAVDVLPDAVHIYIEHNIYIHGYAYET